MNQSKTLREIQDEEIEIRKSREVMETRPQKKGKKDPIIIVLYAEKGGVGKTTLCSTLAWIFAEEYRVLLYDMDSQRNSTTWLFGNELNARDNISLNDLIDEKIRIAGKDPNSEKKSFCEQMADEERDIRPAFAHKIIKNLYLVPGGADIASLDTDINNIETLSKNFPSVPNNKTGKPYNAIIKTALEYEVDYVFLDLNPNCGSMNQRLIMTSHYLIVPSLPDFFGSEMMERMCTNLKNWQKGLEEHREKANRGDFNLPEHSVKFLGYILNRYVPVGSYHNMEIQDGIAQDQLRANQKSWFFKIQEHANAITGELSNAIPQLAISSEAYQTLQITNMIGKCKEYWSLNDFSSIFHVPVPFLEERHMYKSFFRNQVSGRVDEHEEDEENEEFDNYHDNNVEEERFKKVLSKDRKKHFGFIKEWKQIFKQIKCNIVNLINNDRIIE